MFWICIVSWFIIGFSITYAYTNINSKLDKIKTKIDMVDNQLQDIIERFHKIEESNEEDCDPINV